MDKIPEDLGKKIEKLYNFENNQNKLYFIKEKVIQENLMNEETEDIIGVSLSIDKETKNEKEIIQFTQIELENLMKHMNYFGENLEILKISKLNNFSFNLQPNYDCAVIEVNEDSKNYVDITNHKSYSLLNNEPYFKVGLSSQFYIIKFINKNMIKKEH